MLMCFYVWTVWYISNFTSRNEHECACGFVAHAFEELLNFKHAHACLSACGNLCMPFSLLWGCLHVQMWLCIQSICVRMRGTNSIPISFSLISVPLGALQLTWKGRGAPRDCGSEQGLLAGGEARSKGSFGLDGTSKHSSFATAILFSHNFNFKEPSGCISIWLG